MAEYEWVITGYDGDRIIYETKMPAPALSKKGVETLLQRLTAHHLDHDDIVAASRRRGSRGYLPHLEVRKDPNSNRPTYMTMGTGAYFTATYQAT